MKNTATVEEAIASLKAGGVGVLPTDTVYGVVARAADREAVKRLYGLKRREGKPGTVVAANAQQLKDLGVDERYLKQVEQYWPGAVSVETPYHSDDNDLDQGTGHCAWRVVADEGLRRVLEQTGPLQTSSANHAGEPSATGVEMARAYFGDEVDFYVDGGDLSGRLPSTVIRVDGERIEVKRQGAVKLAS
ncbi:MAG: hypothetical protein K0S68_353 [Candidatus Saccharibacteria bacterium]|jgi:L-threonylcarbamoyladenylate synthase|nr:hypothetical protein [Candidatus Saccharibacteria bacterium]